MNLTRVYFQKFFLYLTLVFGLLPSAMAQAFKDDFFLRIEAVPRELEAVKIKAEAEILRNTTYCRGAFISAAASNWSCKAEYQKQLCERKYRCKRVRADFSRATEARRIKGLARDQNMKLSEHKITTYSEKKPQPAPVRPERVSGPLAVAPILPPASVPIDSSVFKTESEQEDVVAEVEPVVIAAERPMANHIDVFEVKAQANKPALGYNLNTMTLPQILTLIRADFNQQHFRVLRDYADKKKVDEEILTPELLTIYEKVVVLKHQELKGDRLKSLPREKQLNFLDDLKLYANICIDHGRDGDPIYDALDGMEIYLDLLEKKTYRWFLRTSFGYATWKDTLTLESDVIEVNLRTTISALAFGGEIVRGNEYYDFSLGFGMTTGNSVVSFTSDQLDYFDDSVAVVTFTLAPGLHWKPVGPNSSFGAEFLMIYGFGGYEDPPNFEVKGNNALRLGVAAIYHWHFSRFSYYLSLGKVRDYESTLLRTGIKFRF